MKTIIETINLSKDFKEEKIIKDLNIKVNLGDIYGFLGPNGAGKSTTIKMMLGLVVPTKGTVIINGFDIQKDREKAIEHVGAMVEAPSFYTYLSGYKNLVLYANLYGLPNKRVDEVLEMVGLSSAKDKNVSKYSLGMKQRLAIARAFLNRPKIIILDEPTNGLDPQGVIEIRNLIKELAHREQVTFILCSHILSEVQALCNRVAIIYNGSLVVEGSVDTLLESPYDCYYIETPEIEKVRVAFSGLPMIAEIIEDVGGVKVKVEKGKFNQINTILVSHNINVTSIKKQELSLEDYFVKVIGDERKHA